MMLKLKLQYFGHFMRRVDSLEKTLMLGGIGGRRRAQQDKMAGWHHRLDGHESEWTPGVGAGQGGVACCDSWGRKESDTTEQLNWTELIMLCTRFYAQLKRCKSKEIIGTAVPFENSGGSYVQRWLGMFAISVTLMFTYFLNWSKVAVQCCVSFCCLTPWITYMNTYMPCSLPGSSVHGIFQARILEWVAIPFSRGSSQLRNQTQVSHTAGRLFTVWANRD